MFNPTLIVIEAFIRELRTMYERTYGILEPSCIRSALVLWQSIVFWSGFSFNFPIVASHCAS